MKTLKVIVLALVMVAAGWTVERGLRGGMFEARAATVERGKLKAERTIEGRVTRVSDGDTIWVTDAMNLRRKIRMLDIDAPESSQPYGKESTKALSSRIYTKQVRVTYRELDQYGRVLGTVWLDGEDVNLWMVRQGHAWAYHYTKTPTYLTAMQKAKSAKLGLWAKDDAMDPWAYRKLKKGQPIGNSKGGKPWNRK